MLTLEKVSSMRNAMEKSVYGRRFKSIYPLRDIVHLILRLMYCD